MTRSVLILTCGQTDVQLVDQGKKCEFDKHQVGAVHDRLRAHPEFWKLVDAPPERGDAVKELADRQPWEICTPKFDAVLAYFGETPPSSVLFLETTRNIAGDPRFAGGVLQIRAKGKDIDDVRCLAYLGPADRNLEDRDCPLDAIIRRDVVSRIEGAIRDVVKDATRVVVATTGGMPEVKALVKELVRLHSPAIVEPDEVEVEDGARNNGLPDKAVSRRRVDPIEPVRLRKQSLSLIERGNLIGAWGAVQHLDPQAHPWTLPIDWLYRFAASLPMSAGCDIDVMRHPCMAVRAALRVELALRAGDIPRAVHGTVAFFEAALWDWLRIRDFAANDDAKGTIAEGFSFSKEPCGEKKRRFRKRNGENKWRIDDFNEGVKAWLRVFCKPELCAMWRAIDDIRDLRNDVAHNEPTPALMNDARSHMQSAALWSNTNTFLSQALVKNVLVELGVGCPEQILDNFLNCVRNRVLSVSSSETS